MEEKNTDNIENKENINDKQVIIQNTKNIKKDLNENNQNWYNKYNKYKIIIIIASLVVILFILFFYYKINICNLFQFSIINNSLDTLENKDAEKITIKNDWNLETEIQKLLQKQNIYIQEKKI